MKGKYLRKIGGFILIVLLVPGVVTLLSSTTAQAQRRVIIVRPVRPFFNPWWGYGRFGPYPYYGYYGYYNQYVFGSSESAYDRGYNEGLKTGENDARRHQSYNPERSHYFRDAGFGNFAGAYREGFERGYANGFRA
jgi:hypothetical protein